VLGDIYLTNFNISVGVHDAFMVAVLNNDYWWMVDPEFSDTTTGVGDYRIHYAVSRATGLGRFGKLLEDIKTPFISILEDEIEKSLAKAKTVIDKLGLSVDQKNPYAWRTKARLIWREIVRGAWESGDPGILYLDNHNKWSPTPWLGAVAATNPCGEQPLYPFESCNLGSMSVEKYVNSDGRFDVERFAEDVAVAVDAMDAVIDLNKHPDERQTIANEFTRKIGLGIMGLADALAKLGYPYDSEEAVAFTLAVMAALEAFSWKRSWELGKIRGPAPAFSCRVWDWRNMVCLEEGKPEELVEMHTPAFVKASMVARFEDRWLKVRYHDVKIPQELINALYGEAKNRVEPDGTVKLVRLDALKKVLRDVFNIDEKVVEEALKMSPESLVNSPRHLLALAIFEPGLAWERLKEYGRRIGAVAPRNTVTTTVAPTGSISIIAGTSSGIEPYFAIVYRRVVAVGDFLEVVRLFRDKLLKLLDEVGVDRSVAEEIFDVISRNKGSVRKSLSQIVALFDLPDNVVKGLEELAKLFPTTLDIDPWYHLAHQAAAQLYVDQSISKTVNLPKNAPERAVETVFIVGWLLGLKGITIYRDESKAQQVIQFGSVKGEKKSSSKGFRLGQESVEAGVTGSKTVAVSEEGEVVVDQDTNSTCLTCEV
jgi:ribonucleoside-diphosphate reductase alpha chain